MSSSISNNRSTPSRQRTSKYSISQDPYQRAAILFALFQTSKTVSANGVSFLGVGPVVYYFSFNERADILVIFSADREFDKELAVCIAHNFSQLFARQGISSQNSPRASSIRQFRQEMKMYVQEVLQTTAKALSTMLLPSSSKDVDRNLCIYFEGGNKPPKMEKIKSGDINPDPNTDIKAECDGDIKKNSEVSTAMAVSTPSSAPIRGGRSFTVTSMESSKFSIPVPPISSYWVNAIKSILGLRNTGDNRSSQSTKNQLDHKSTIPQKSLESGDYSLHLKHYVFNSVNDECFSKNLFHLEGEKYLNETINEIVSSKFEEREVAQDRPNMEVGGSIGLLSNFERCHYVWFYTQPQCTDRTDSSNVSVLNNGDSNGNSNSKSDFQSISSKELLADMRSMGKSTSLSSLPTHKSFELMRMCSSLIYLLEKI